MKPAAAFPIPNDLAPIISALPQSYIVGGAVRDYIIGKDSKDIDIEVFGLEWDSLLKRLEGLGKLNVVGKSFAVAKLSTPDGNTYNIALARRESKTGVSHKDFKVDTSPNITIEEAAARKDLTINAILLDPREMKYVDPFNGLHDIQNKILRHTSSSFAEDPLRVLRIVQFAGRFDMGVDSETAHLCRSIQDQFHHLPIERVSEEWMKWASYSVKPSRGIDALIDTGWINCFPALKKMVGVAQEPDYHPEIYLDKHVKYCLDAIANNPDWNKMPPHDRATLMFAVLCHDIAKPDCTALTEKEGKLIITSHGHEAMGVSQSQDFLKSIGIHKYIINQVKPLVGHHMHHINIQSENDILRLAVNLAPSNIRHLALLCFANHAGRPPKPQKLPTKLAAIVNHAAATGILDTPPTPLISGQDIINLGLKPSPTISTLQKLSFEAQINGVFNTRPTALNWIKDNMLALISRCPYAPKQLITSDDLLSAGLKPGPVIKEWHNHFFTEQLAGRLIDKNDALNHLRTHLAIQHKHHL